MKYRIKKYLCFLGFYRAGVGGEYIIIILPFIYKVRVITFVLPICLL